MGGSTEWRVKSCGSSSWVRTRVCRTCSNYLLEKPYQKLREGPSGPLPGVLRTPKGVANVAPKAKLRPRKATGLLSENKTMR